MGITADSLTRIERYNKIPCRLLILGCQNLYNADNYGEIAHAYYQAKGYDVRSWDILGCQGSEIVDLRDDLKLQAEYDLILQHGTIEHIEGNIYNAFKNIHEACKSGGIIIHENPATQHWPGHGYHYFSLGFYQAFCHACDYKLMEHCGEYAMGNTVDGLNICAVIQKKKNNLFIAEAEFKKLYEQHLFTV